MAEPLRTVYSAIKNLKEKYGMYYKTCLHLHTPASYDYHLRADWDDHSYKKATAEQLFQLCVDKALFLPDAQLSDVSKEFWGGYKNEKEFFAYLLIANELLANRFGMVVVTDHNSIEGVEKLRLAISHVKRYKAYELHPVVICGVEITCADKNHVVGIISDDESVRKKLNDWLKENLYSMKEGVVKLSLEVLEFLRSLGGVGYIAHIDSFESFTKGHFSGAYKKTVLEKESLFGLSNIRAKEKQLEIISSVKKKDYFFVLDNDAHDIDTICDKPIWIKCENRSCAAIKEAFGNYRTSVLLEEPTRAKKYIEGLYIAHRDQGFLCDKEHRDTPFIMRFSDELNCLIGGRGTGKSTVLAVLEYALAQRCSSERELEFICRHGNIYVLYWDNGKEYLIEMRTAFKPQTDSILRRFGQNPRDQYRWRYKFKPDEIGQYARDHYVDIYLVSHQTSELTFVRQKDKKNLLRQLFDTKYSINELVNTAGGDEISDYLYHVLFENRTLTDAEAAISCRSFEGLKKTINDVKNVLKKRESEVNAVVEPFNSAKRGVFEIEYRQDETPQEPPVESWLFSSDNLWAWFTCGGVRYNIKNEDVVDYLLSLYHELGFLEFIKLCVNRDSSRAEETVQLLSFCSEMSQSMVDDGIEQLKKDQTRQIVSDILARTITKQNADTVIQYLKHAVKEIESFSLKFNINSNESVRTQKADYRDVRDLSLGQKVVAMLSFVLGYSEHMRDFRPLIIDQPEDNLDNQYIYQTLVRQLREEKYKRQVIIATHNASLVTNTNAEQVCVMESNGDNGWVESRGYVGTAIIKKHIVNYLEGGIESFKHKCEIYHDVLFKA